MAYVHIAGTRGRSIADFRRVAEKHDPPGAIDGLLVLAAGSDDDGLHVVTVWQSKAHCDRFAAEQLFPAFQSLGLASEIAASSDFTTYDADELYVAAATEG